MGPDRDPALEGRVLIAAPTRRDAQITCELLERAAIPCEAFEALSSLAAAVYEGVGAIMRWNGNRNIGEGAMSVTQSAAPNLVRYRLEFLKPFKATNTAELLFTPVGEQTLVSWSMYGDTPFMGKLMNLLVNCKGMIEKQFDKGLADLKALAEAKS